MAYTPGPWRTYRDKNQRVSQIMSNNGRICTIHPSDANGEANARLIAAAPELLEALEICRKAITRLDEDGLGMYMREDGHGGIDYWPYTVELLQRIDTVIAKAKGEVPDA